jgi:hydroxymethylpyrimidine/phosphomethylpyrimidine kinase
VKIGIVPSLAYLQEIVLALKGFRQKTSIVWDTVLKSSTEYDFLNIENQSVLKNIKNVDYAHHEIIQLSPAETNAENIAKMLSACAILLKGGHHPEKIGIDTLYTKKRSSCFTQKIIAHRKTWFRLCFIVCYCF